MRLTKKIIYITYDSVLEPLGQSQVLKYISKSNEILKTFFCLVLRKNFSNKNILNYTKDILMMQILNGNIYFIVINVILSTLLDILK